MSIHPTRRHLLAATLSFASLSGPAAAQATIGKPAPEFEGLENWTNGGPLSLAGLRGQVTLVDFWTYGCSDCVVTLPTLVELQRDLAHLGLVIVGVHTPEFAWEHGLRGLQRAIKQNNIAYPVAQDNQYRTWRAYGVNYWPTTVIVDRTGTVAAVHEGSNDVAKLRAQIEALL